MRWWVGARWGRWGLGWPHGRRWWTRERGSPRRPTGESISPSTSCDPPRLRYSKATCFSEREEVAECHGREDIREVVRRQEREGRRVRGVGLVVEEFVGARRGAVVAEGERAPEREEEDSNPLYGNLKESSEEEPRGCLREDARQEVVDSNIKEVEVKSDIEERGPERAEESDELCRTVGKELESLFKSIETINILLHNRKQSCTVKKLVDGVRRSGKELTMLHLELIRSVFPSLYSYVWRGQSLHIHFNNNWRVHGEGEPPLTTGTVSPLEARLRQEDFHMRLLVLVNGGQPIIPSPLPTKPTPPLPAAIGTIFRDKMKELKEEEEARLGDLEEKSEVKVKEASLPSLVERIQAKEKRSKQLEKVNKEKKKVFEVMRLPKVASLVRGVLLDKHKNAVMKDKLVMEVYSRYRGVVAKETLARDIDRLAQVTST